MALRVIKDLIKPQPEGGRDVALKSGSLVKIKTSDSVGDRLSSGIWTEGMAGWVGHVLKCDDNWVRVQFLDRLLAFDNKLECDFKAEELEELQP